MFVHTECVFLFDLSDAILMFLYLLHAMLYMIARTLVDKFSFIVIFLFIYLVIYAIKQISETVDTMS